MNHFYQYFVQEHKKKLIFYIFITFLNVFLEVLGLAAFFLMIGYLLNTNVNLAILDVFKINDEYFLNLIILILFIYFVKIIFQIFCIFFQKKIIIELQESLFFKLLKKYLFLSYEESSKDNSVIKLRYLTSETKSAVMYISGYLNIVTESIYVFGILAFLLFNYFTLSFSIILILLFFGIIYYFFFKKKIVNYAKSKILNDNELYNKIVQSINGLND
jgi:ABC-type multidrug transport system fused ATPase/permease subunit